MTKYKCNTSKLMHLTKGKIYECELHPSSNHFWVSCDSHELDFIHKDWFDLVEEPVIEVGSEWVSSKNGMPYIVTAIGEQKVLCKHSTSEKDEYALNKDDFNTIMKPKPKTVTMYFYKDCVGLVHSYSEPMSMFGEYLFTKEIEL